MLEYNRIDISEGTDINKTNLSKECDIFHYWYFRDIGFKYEPDLCNGCHDLMQKAINNIAIVCVRGSAYRNNFWYMSKDDAINIMNNSNLVDKRGVLYIFFIVNFLLYIKMSENADLTYYQSNRDVILNKAKDFCQNDKKRLREQARDKYGNLSEEEKNKIRECGKNRYRNVSEDKKKTLKEYQYNNNNKIIF